MLRARTRTGHTSVLARCSRLAALILILFVSPCEALTVTGVPSWLEGAVVRGLSAVWSEIPDDVTTDREGTLEVVASRLFSGYRVRVMAGENEPVVKFTPNSDEIVPVPEVRLIPPELRGMAAMWFVADTDGIAAEVSRLAGEIPQGALTWADEELRSRVSRIVHERLPGWEFTQQIYISPSTTSINLSFRPSSEMILAVKPMLYSRTIPVMFRSDLEAKIIPEMSLLIGLPVKWAELHRHDIESLARASLEERNTVGNMRAAVSVNFSAGKVSEVEARVDSRSLMFSVWVSAYAGLDGRYPEAGAFFGFRPMWRIGDVNLAPEVYTELIFELDDFGLTFRAGTRFELVENFWGGIEYQMPEDELFMRLEYIPLKVRRPYARWRWGLRNWEHELGLGYRFDEHISAEIYYDGNIGIRGIWNL